MSIDIYCDGSTINNGKKGAVGGIGVMFYDDDFQYLNVSEPLYITDNHTNQKAEIIAMTKTFSIINETKELSKFQTFNVYSDSMYTINCLKWIPGWIKNGWKKADKSSVLNIEYLKVLWSEYNMCKNKVKIFHVKAHTSNDDKHTEGNKFADKLATLASQSILNKQEGHNHKSHETYDYDNYDD